MNQIPTKQLLTFQKKLKKNPEGYFRRAFVNSILSTMLLEDEHISREEIEKISYPQLQSLSRHGYFEKFKT